MEYGVFRRSAVAENLEQNFVEARIHTDDPLKPELRDLQVEMVQTIQNPYYLVLDPATRERHGDFGRALTPGESSQAFLDFLDQARRRARETEAASR